MAIPVLIGDCDFGDQQRFRNGSWAILTAGPVWNRIPEAIRRQIVELALDQPELSPRELAVRFTNEEKILVSELRSIGC